MKKEPRDYTITALERGLKVLMLFDGEKSSYTLTELSQLSGIGKSTMLRIVYTFCENGFLTFDENTRRYSLGVCVFRLGMAKMNTLDFRRIALRYLRPLSRETDMICYLGDHGRAGRAKQRSCVGTAYGSNRRGNEPVCYRYRKALPCAGYRRGGRGVSGSDRSEADHPGDGNG